MRKYVLAASVAALALGSSPAFAQSAPSFTGPRVGLIIGATGEKLLKYDDLTIGLDAGYDFDAGGLVAGIGLEYQTDLGSDFGDVNETALLGRLGTRIGSSALLYATGGYSRVSAGGHPFTRNHEDGYRVGGGLEYALGSGATSIKLEQRYLNYGHGVDGFQTVLGLTVRAVGAVREEVAPPPPPVEAAPPPPPPPATQTCADGLVILATDVCPPPPPPPPPAAEPERG
jgi:opacity protein-like surface antigen